MRVAERIAGVLVTGAVVLAIPAACIGGLALYGRSLADSEVAIGTLVSPEVARQRLIASHARFVAMTPREHLDAARAALAPPRRGGARTALDHLGAIPADAPEQVEAEAMRQEIARRRRLWRRRPRG